MECAICLNKINEGPLHVKEIMFGTGKFYSYFKCSFCGCLQIERPEKNTENLYPGNYYSFNTYNISGIIKKIKRLVVRYSVASALGYKSLFNFLFAVNTRDGGAHALKGKVPKIPAFLTLVAEMAA